jgi:hypothetical protein
MWHFLHEWLWQAIYLPIDIVGFILTAYFILSKVRSELFPPKAAPAKKAGKTHTKTAEGSNKMTRQGRVLQALKANLFLILGIVMLIGGLTGASFNMYNKLQNEVNNLLDSVRFGLAFDTVTVNTGNSSEGLSLVTVGIRLRNTSKELIQYEVKNFNVILGNKTVDNPTFLTTGCYVFPGQTSDYFYPTIDGVDLSKPVSGTLEYEIHYSSVPNKYWYLSSRKFALDLWQGQTVWHTLKQEESPISQQ